jgi:hypothetical protein
MYGNGVAEYMHDGARCLVVWRALAGLRIKIPQNIMNFISQSETSVKSIVKGKTSFLQHRNYDTNRLRAW